MGESRYILRIVIGKEAAGGIPGGLKPRNHVPLRVQHLQLGVDFQWFLQRKKNSPSTDVDHRTGGFLYSFQRDWCIDLVFDGGSRDFKPDAGPLVDFFLH